jgi:hypothetical protein
MLLFFFLQQRHQDVAGLHICGRPRGKGYTGEHRGNECANEVQDMTQVIMPD